MTSSQLRIKKIKRGLGFWMLTALVTGNMIGSGIFLLPSALAPFAMLGMSAWVFTAIGSLFLALIFAKLSQWKAKVGGPYAYCREAFGDFAGFQVAYNYWIGLWVGDAAIAVAFVGYLGVFFPVLIQDRNAACFVAIGTVWFLTIINIVSVRQAGFIQLITTILKLLPLLCIGTIGFLYINPDHFKILNMSEQSNLSAFSSAAALTLWAFIGLESASVPASEVENPEHIIPRATIVGVLITTLIYICSSLAVFGIIPIQQLMHSTAPYADAAKIIFGRSGELIIAAGAAISAFGTLNGWILSQARVPYAAATDTLFPHSFSKEAKSGTPIVGLLVSAVLITLLLLLTLKEQLMRQFTLFTLLAVMATLIPYLLTSMATIILFLKHRMEFPAKGGAVIVIIAILSFLYSFWALIGAGQEVVFYGSLLFFTSIPVYVWNYWRRAKHKTL